MHLDYDTFVMGTDKEAALKPLEEAAEVFGAWQVLAHGAVLDSMTHQPPITEHRQMRLADELADCIQACCNLAARFDLDLDAAMLRCRERNHRRGRY